MTAFTRNSTTQGSQKAMRRPTAMETGLIIVLLAVLAAILTPTIREHVTLNRIAFARQETRRIGDAIVAMHRDAGRAPDIIHVDGGSALRVDLLVSPGAAPAAATSAAAGWAGGRCDTFAHQLIENTPQYPVPSPCCGGKAGWSGPYLSRSVDADPWGRRYVCNIVAFAPGSAAGTDDGDDKPAVFVLSAGPDGIVQTPFDQPALTAGLRGDDVGCRIQ